MLRSDAMSARAIATATVSFGMVSIPVKLFSAGNTDAGVRFNMLHRACGSRLKQQYVCPKDDVVVTRADMAKGYEFTKGRYVMFSDEEIKALQQQASQAIEIVEFLPVESVDPIYFDKSYYLGPDKGGDRAYRLLAAALEKSGRAAIARYAARGKQYLVMLRPRENGLVMQQLRYSDEVRTMDEVPIGDATVDAGQLKLALQIVDQAVVERFRPAAFKDDVKERMLAEIEKKIDGEEITAAPEESDAPVIDLMEALKASLGTAPRKPAKRAAKPRKTATSKKAAAKKAIAKKTAKSSRKRAAGGKS